MLFVRERWAGDGDRLSTIAALLLHLGLVAQRWVTEGPKPSVCWWFSIRHLVLNWLRPSVHLVILLFNVHLFPLFFRLFTQVHLLIDGSVEDQYVTKIPEKFVRLILQDRFWVVHMPFVRIVKLKFLAQFPVDQLAHPVVSSLILYYYHYYREFLL